jgi:hypothetical protein
MAKRKPITLKELKEFGERFDKQWHSPNGLPEDDSPISQTVMVLAYTAYVEHLLMILLDKVFVELECAECKECKKGNRCSKNDTIFSPKEPLESYSKCADLALRLGLITPLMRANLAHVGSIRNLFAHHPSLMSFDDVEVRKHCECLRFPHSLGNKPSPAFESDIPSERFESAILWASCSIENIQERAKRFVTVWPKSLWNDPGC